MKLKQKIFLALLILIIFITALFRLTIDVAVFSKLGGSSTLPLNNNAHVFKLRSPVKFNALTARFLTNALPLNGKVDFFIKDKAFNGQVLAKGSLTRNLGQGEYYKISFSSLRANTDYFLEIKGSKGVNYWLQYRGEDNSHESKSVRKGDLVYKLYQQKPVINVVAEASEKAARDWFGLGPMYVISLFVYLAIMAVILSWVVYEKA